MEDMRMNLSQPEQLARAISGLEGNTTFFNPDVKTLDEMVEDRNRNMWNDKVEEMNKAFDEHSKKLQDYADEYAAKLNGVEIMPVNAGILVQPYDENPFQKVKVTDSGIIYDLGGKRPEYKNTDTGEFEEAEQYIKVGVVVEAGPLCRWIRQGDTIMWNKSGEVPIPFYSMGLHLVNEQHVMCVINDDLTKRFEKLKKEYGK